MNSCRTFVLSIVALFGASQRRAPSSRYGPFRVGRRSGSDWVVDAWVSRPNNKQEI